MELRTLIAVAIIAVPHFSQAAAKSVSNQPTTYVQASPLKISQAEKMRQQRMELEADTEEQIYQELEKARIADEQRRAQKYLNHSAQPQPTYQPQVIAETPANYVVVNNNSTVTPQPSVKVADESSTKFYFSLVGGLIDQYQATNVSANGGGGLSLGVEFANHISLEGTFMYANLTSTHGYCNANNSNCGPGTPVDMASKNNIDQYYSSLAAKYNFDFGFWLQPSIGLVMAYNYREHLPGGTRNLRRSQALDGGGSLGVDVVLSDWVRLGMDWRYMTNFAYQLDGKSQAAALNLREVPLRRNAELVNFESTDYQVWMFSAKFLF